MKLYCPITIDLYKVYPLQVMEAQQGNVGRGAIVTLTAGSAVIDPTDETVEVYAKKPDGTVSWLECSVEDGKIKIDFTNQMLMSPGILQVELRMKDDEDDITTPIFKVKVNKSNVQSAGRSENELPLLDQIKKNAEDAKTAAEAAETAVGNKVTNPAIGAVGQILEIETVDDEGKPLTYKAVEKPESGVDKELSQIIHASKYGMVSDGFSDTVIVIGKDAAAGDVIKYVIEENSGDITVIYDNNDTGEFNITTIDHAGEAAGEKTLTAEKYCTYTFPSEMDVYLPFNIPTKTSQLTDDVGFAKQEEVGKLSEEIAQLKEVKPVTSYMPCTIGYTYSSKGIKGKHADDSRSCPDVVEVMDNLLTIGTNGNSFIVYGNNEGYGYTTYNVRGWSNEDFDVSTTEYKYLFINISGTSATTDPNTLFHKTELKVAFKDFATEDDLMELKAFSNLLNLGNVLKTVGKTPIATWIDDDTANVSAVSNVKSICDTLDIKCTFGCVTNNLTDELIATLKQYQREGFHITTHSHTHQKGTESNPFWYPSAYTGVVNSESDLIQSLEILNEKGFLDCNYLVIPGGNNNQDLLNMVSKWCECALLSDSNNGINHLYGYGRYKLCRIFIRPTSEGGKTLDEYKAVIDRAYTNGDWLILGTHSGMPAQWDETLVNNVISYAISKGFPFETLNQAWKKRKYNYVMNEIFS